MYVLNYLDDASLRSYVQRALNRREAYHQLRRAVASVKDNRFRGSSDQEIDFWYDVCPVVDEWHNLLQLTHTE